MSVAVGAVLALPPAEAWSQARGTRFESAWAGLRQYWHEAVGSEGIVGGTLAFFHGDFDRPYRSNQTMVELALSTSAGLSSWLIASLVVLGILTHRFRKMTNRSGVTYPDRAYRRPGFTLRDRG